MSLSIDIYNLSGEKIKDITVSENIFGRELNNELISQYLRVFLTNQRVGNASTKTRGEVSGSGKKPFKQKGTGNARRGSLRTPLAVKGGITFGPKPKDFRLELPRKMRVGALLNILSSRYLSKSIFGIDSMEALKKTKDIVTFMNKLNITNTKTLVITPKYQPEVLKSISNIEKLSVKSIDNLNAFDIISNKNLVLLEDTFVSLQEKYENK
ncbi:50S ribosomal protein L4 [bacterium]|jgi:large subunit ribosomal protein L4|nr:50S ribosomal protein L4 [bacterium]